MELIAVELRHLQRTEVREVMEGFRAGQKGSSAMPHKRNPISAETISGLSRILRSNLQAGMQDIALWHERDISHSSVERVILPDSSLLAYYVMRRGQRLLAGLSVDGVQMRANLDSSHGLVFSQAVLLALVQAGMSRDDAYAIVQRHALQAWDERRDVRALLESDPAVAALGADVLDRAFSLDRSLQYAQQAVDALDDLLP
jgi:adenylosuccinate lyase